MAKETKQPVVFISYSHFDEPEHPGPEEIKWLSFVRKFLRPLEKHGVLRFWDDGRIRGGANWRPEIERELNACDVCILLVSPNSLSSDFILDKEVKPMLERRKNEGVHIYPIHITPTPFEGAEWLTEMQIRPSKDKSLFESPLPEREAKMVAIVKEIARLLEGMATTGKRAARPQHQASNSAQQVIDYGRLPETPYAKLVGREAELKQLDETWADEKVNILSLVADGGVGKSALVMPGSSVCKLTAIVERTRCWATRSSARDRGSARPPPSHSLIGHWKSSALRSTVRAARSRQKSSPKR